MAEEDWLSTPAEYATPEQLKAVRAYSAALLHGDQQQPVKHWTQGLSNMVSALVGGYTQYRAGQRETGSRLQDANASPRPVSETDGGAADASPAGSGVASVRNNNPGAQWPGEDSAKFGSTGSQNIAGGNKIASFDDPVNGAAAQFSLLDRRYAGKPLSALIAKWSGAKAEDPASMKNAQEYALKVASAAGLSPNDVITPEFLRSPAGRKMAAAMADWEAGGKYPMSPEQWEKGQALAYGANPPANPAFGGAQPASEADNMVTALNGPKPKPPAAPMPPGAARSIPNPSGNPGGGADIPPGIVPRSPRVTREEFVRTMASPYVPPAQKELVSKLYYSQGQPVSVDRGPYGVTTFGPDGSQYTVPKVDKEEQTGAGGAKRVRDKYFTEGAGGVPVKKYLDADEPVEAAPSSGRPPAPDVVPDLAPPKPQSSVAPDVLQGSAGNDQLQGNIGNDELKPDQPPGMLGVAPPALKGGDAAAVEEPLTRLAGESNAAWEKRQQKQYLDLEARKELNKKDADEYVKTSGEIKTLGDKARGQNQALQIAAEIIKDPRMIQGFAANPRLKWAEAMNYLGVDPKAATLNHEFDKIISANILGDLKTVLQGLGQVRVAEIGLLEKAAPSKYNTYEANKFIIDTSIRASKQLATLSDVAHAYSAGVRWDGEGRVIRGPDGKPQIFDERPTAAGLEKAKRDYMDRNPLFTKDEIKDHLKLFDAGTKPDGTPMTKPGGFFTPAKPKPVNGPPPPEGFQ